MNDPFISSNEIKIELKEIELLGMHLYQKVLILSHSIGYILSKIKMCDTIESAKDYFDILTEMQAVLATLVFEKEIMIPEILINFVSNFDNIEWNREYLFKEIKKGTFNWRRE